jgi:putative Ca2+/H+ antiporter (TMEM165/GDT1 family)
MDAFLTSSLLVAVAEIGDKTQLLAIVLATRFRKPVPIDWSEADAPPVAVADDAGDEAVVTH